MSTFDVECNRLGARELRRYCRRRVAVWDVYTELVASRLNILEVENGPREDVDWALAGNVYSYYQCNGDMKLLK